jgi:hypothetical protein
VLPLAGCVTVVRGPVVTGSGTVKSETRPAADFSRIALSGVGHLTVKQTDRESLTVTAEDNILPHLESKVEDGTLTLKVADNVNLSPSKPITYTVEVKSLEGLSLSGAGTAEATGLDGKQLTVTVSGTGNVTLAGKAEELTVTLSGAGTFKGEGFAVKRAAVRSSGVGHAVVNASEELTASVSGVGNIEYLGDPKVKSSVSGVGKVRKR